MKYLKLLICSFCLLHSDVGEAAKVVGEKENSILDSVQIHFKEFKQGSGLSQGMIYSMSEDSLGYLWLATKDGLNRFDGKNFKVYRHERDKPQSLSESHITTTLIDHSGNLWLGTYSGNLIYFDRPKNHFYTISDSSSPSGIDNSILDLVELPNGDLLLHTASRPKFQIVKRSLINDLKSDRSIDFIPLDQIYPVGSQLMKQSGYYRKVLVGAANKLWFFISDQAHYIDLSVKIPDQKLHSYKITEVKDSKYGSRVINFFIPNAADSSIYYTDFENRIFKFNESSLKFDLVKEIPKNISSNSQFFVDKDEWLWVLEAKGKLFMFDLNSDSIIHSKFDSREVPDQNKFLLYELLADQEGNYWIGTIGYGLYRFSKTYKFFREVELNQAISKRKLRSIRINRTKLFDHEFLSKWSQFNIDSLLIALKLRSVNDLDIRSEDSAGNIYLYAKHSLSNQLYYLMIPNDFNQSREYFMRRIRSSNHPSFVIPFSADSIWSVDRTRISIDNWQWSDSSATKHYKHPITYSGEYPFFSDLLIDEQNTVWLATRRGVLSFNLITKKFQHFKLSNNSITIPCFSVTEDPTEKNILWVGTDNYGLIKFHKQKGILRTYIKSDGLSNEVIYGILTDHKNNLWLSTNQGLNLFNPETEIFRVFGEGDGLRVTEFDKYYFSKDVSGNLYFYGEGTLTKVDPKRFYENRKGSKVQINQLKLFNEKVDYKQGVKNELVKMDAALPFARNITLSSGAEMFSLGFSLMDKKNPEAHKFKYRLLGFNDQWVELDHTSEAIFTNLSQGDFTFEVKGYNSSDLWGPIARLQITVLPAWYESWWFFVLAGIIFSSIIWTIYRYRLEQALKVERMRNDIAKDLHDEIGSTISSISLYGATLLHRSKDLNQDSKKLINKIMESSQEVLGNMNDMVWSIKAETESFDRLANRLRAYAFDVTEAKEIKLLINFDFNESNLKLTITQRKNLYLIFKEVINNAVKHSNANEINLSIRSGQRKLIMQLQDNGIGFSREKSAPNTKGGNGLQNMYDRAEEIQATLQIDSIEGQGSRITLEHNY